MLLFFLERSLSAKRGWYNGMDRRYGCHRMKCSHSNQFSNPGNLGGPTNPPVPGQWWDSVLTPPLSANSSQVTVTTTIISFGRYPDIYGSLEEDIFVCLLQAQR